MNDDNKLFLYTRKPKSFAMIKWWMCSVFSAHSMNLLLISSKEWKYARWTFLRASSIHMTILSVEQQMPKLAFTLKNIYLYIYWAFWIFLQQNVVHFSYHLGHLSFDQYFLTDTFWLFDWKTKYMHFFRKICINDCLWLCW